MNYDFELPYDLEGSLGAQRLYLTRIWWSMALVRQYLIFCVIFTPMYILLSDEPRTLDLLLVGVLFGVIAAAIFLAMMFLVQQICLPILIRRSAKQLKREGTTCRFILSEDKLTVKDTAFGGEVAWEDLHRWTENDRFMLLCRSQGLFYYLPKWRLPEGVEADVRDRVLRAGVLRL